MCTLSLGDSMFAGMINRKKSIDSNRYIDFLPTFKLNIPIFSDATNLIQLSNHRPLQLVLSK